MKAITNKTTSQTVFDPVCGMTVINENACLVMAHGGHLHHFCSQGCRMTFKTNPSKYLRPNPSKSRNWFGRFLDRLARTNEKEFGGGRPACCG